MGNRSMTCRLKFGKQMYNDTLLAKKVGRVLRNSLWKYLCLKYLGTTEVMGRDSGVDLGVCGVDMVAELCDEGGCSAQRQEALMAPASLQSGGGGRSCLRGERQIHFQTSHSYNLPPPWMERGFQEVAEKDRGMCWDLRPLSLVSYPKTREGEICQLCTPPCLASHSSHLQTSCQPRRG
jgi:hypothetical protein